MRRAPHIGHVLDGIGRGVDEIHRIRADGYGAVVAAFVTLLNAPAIAPSAASASWPRPCRLASQLGSLYESQVAPDASCQTSALSGRSIPIVWTDCINGVPPLALPKIRSSVGRSASPTWAAPAA